MEYDTETLIEILERLKCPFNENKQKNLFIVKLFMHLNAVQAIVFSEGKTPSSSLDYGERTGVLVSLRIKVS